MVNFGSCNQLLQKAYYISAQMRMVHCISMVDCSPLLTVVSFLGDKDYDSIKFASYRTASKLLFIQKKANCKSPVLSQAGGSSTGFLRRAGCWQY